MTPFACSEKRTQHATAFVGLFLWIAAQEQVAPAAPRRAKPTLCRKALGITPNAESPDPYLPLDVAVPYPEVLKPTN